MLCLLAINPTVSPISNFEAVIGSSYRVRTSVCGMIQTVRSRCVSGRIQEESGRGTHVTKWSSISLGAMSDDHEVSCAEESIRKKCAGLQALTQLHIVIRVSDVIGVLTRTITSLMLLALATFTMSELSK